MVRHYLVEGRHQRELSKTTFRRWSSGLQELYALSEAARSKGLDPSLKTECIIAKDIADLVEGLVGPPGVALSIRDLGIRLQREEIAFKVAEEIVNGKFGHFGT